MFGVRRGGHASRALVFQKGGERVSGSGRVSWASDGGSLGGSVDRGREGRRREVSECEFDWVLNLFFLIWLE